MPRYQFLLVTLICFLLTACSGSTTPAASPAPVFTSSPGTQAVEGSPYSYQLAANDSATKFSLTNAPSGATLSGNTIAWVPTSQQSRLPNSFTVTATAPGSASATQSWTVTPSGTIRISHVDTLWNESGSTTKPFDWSPITSYVAALVPQPDGTFQSLSGTAGANGTFEIPNVPAGYYWLKLGPRDTYWTSSSTFDVGSDIFAVANIGVAPSIATTYFNFSFTSLDPLPVAGLLQVDALEAGMPPYAASTNAGSTTSVGGFAMNGNLDYSTIKTLFVKQYEPSSFGSVNGYVMGPELTLSNQSFTTGGHNTVSGSLNPTVPRSINLSIKGSAWAPLFAHVAPTAPTAIGGSFYLSVQPYIAANGPNLSLTNFRMPIDLIWTTNSNSSPVFFTPTCAVSPPSMADVEAGNVQYSDPFPPAWRRTFRVCQIASVNISLPGGQTQATNLTNTQTTKLPTDSVKPLLSAVQNPKINGAELFTASTVDSTAVTLNWEPPAIGTPYGYDVQILTPTTLTGGIVRYAPLITLGTAKTSMTIPPNVLAPGKTYLFIITSLADGKANMETSPHRSALPTASAEIVSAPITTN